MSPHNLNAPPAGPADAGALDRILDADPAGSYSVMDAPTRERYRQACRELAAWAGCAPEAAAREAIRLSEAHDPGKPRGRHVGAQLLAEGRPLLEASLGCRVPRSQRALRLARRYASTAYLQTHVVLTALALIGAERLLAARGVELFHRVLVVASLALPILEFWNESIDWVCRRLAGSPPPLPKLDPERIFARDTRTLAVTPLLVTSVEDVEAQLRRLEINYLGNVSPELSFALLTDFRDAAAKELPEDRALTERLERGLRELNARHGFREQPRFFWFHRERRWNPVAGCWMGWERKRGKLDEFNQLVLGGGDTSYTGAVPDVVRAVRYIITVDADTHLPPGSAARLVATLHHPLNQARFDATGKRVIAGYSIIQPALAAGPTRSAWLSGGRPLSLVRQPKPDPFTEDGWALSQLVFGSGNFVGKGIYDVAAFARSLDGWIPENTVLSHDKLEGMFARVACATDILLFEGRPGGLLSYVRIWHRWIRGDWQLLPWIFPRVPSRDGRRVANPLSALDRWRVLSDLRRSLGHPSLLFGLMAGWLWLPEVRPWAWVLGWGLWVCRHPFAFTFTSALRHKSFTARLRVALTAVPRLLASLAFTTVSLLPASGIMLDAIVRALYRLAVDRRRILDWTTHAQTNRNLGSLPSLFAIPEVQTAFVLGLGVAGVLAAFSPAALPWAAAPLLGWLPFVVIVRRERPEPPRPGPPPSELEPLGALARRSWALYEQLAPAGGALPHGVLAEDGASDGAAEVTPTDLALWLVAPLSAYHLGYLGLDELVSRLGSSLATVAALERHRGHLLECYDARTGRPVGPRRVSVAESGMLAAALVVVESGLCAARAPAAAPRPPRQGLLDTLTVLREEAAALPSAARREPLAGELTAMRQALADGATSDGEALAQVRRRWEHLAPERASAGGDGLVAWWERAERQLLLLERAPRPGSAGDEGLLARLGEVEAQARALRESLDFSLLYDRAVELFHVGYDVESDSPDGAHHGLLTSGALLAGFVAIARGEAPLRHWVALIESDQRLRAEGPLATGRATLAEHLLPALFLWAPPATLLGQTAIAAIDAEAERGAAGGVPWGLAGAGRVAPDSGAAQPLTIAPHLSILAQRFRPGPASENRRRVVELGALGRYGLFDALRMDLGTVAVQRTFTCRNQAMILAAVANLACDDILIQHFHQHWQTAWVEALVFEAKAAP